MRVKTIGFGCVAWCLVSGLAAWADDAPFLQSEAIFPNNPKHNHASCIVECPNGDLLVAWYRGSGERQADDVEILGARLRKGATAWGPVFPMADTPGYPDCNPALFAAPDGTLWMFWPTILDHHWESALLKYAVSEDYQNDAGPPRWSRQGVLHITPIGFAEAMKKAAESSEAQELVKKSPVIAAAFRKGEELSRQELYQRLGWMPRVHPTVLPSGRWLLPLYTDTFSVSIVALTDDKGATWKASAPIIGFGNIQPSLVRKKDGTIVAFMRENGYTHRVRVSTSRDEGQTWSPVVSSDLPNPGSGLEAIRLKNGHWVMISNDTPAGRHTLAVSLSDDEGKTWKRTRYLEKHAPGGGSYHYPSIMQAADGSIHVSYTSGRSHQGSTIMHARFNEAWILADDEAAKPETR